VKPCEYRKLCYDMSSKLIKQMAGALDVNDVGVNDPRYWMELVWCEWRRQRFAKAQDRAISANQEVLRAILDTPIKHVPGGDHD